MKKHICKQCNKIYEYCRGCLLSPISYKENGYCSQSCYEASKITVVPVVEDATPIEEVSIEVEISAIVEEETVVEAKEMVSTETSVAITVDEPTIKKETSNTYKKKKNKYNQVHE